MIYTVLSNSLITLQSETVVLRPWVDSKESFWYGLCHGYHTGIDIEAEKVHSCAVGTVVSINHADTISVVLQYDANHLISYNHLKEIYVSLNQEIGPGVLLGLADKFVMVEYWVRNKVSQFAARLGTVTYYKTDPLPLLKQCQYVER